MWTPDLMLSTKNSFYRAWAEVRSHLGKVQGGVKRTQILLAGIIAENIGRRLKTIGRTNAHSHVRGQTGIRSMIDAPKAHPDGNLYMYIDPELAKKRKAPL